MTKQRLNGTNVGASLQKMSCETVPETFPCANRNLFVLKINIMYPQSKCFADPHSTSIMQLCYSTIRGILYRLQIAPDRH